MSFPKNQGNPQLRGLRSDQTELRKLEKPAINNADVGPAKSQIAPPDNPTAEVQVDPAPLMIESFSPQFTTESRVFQVDLLLSEPIDGDLLTTRITVLESLTSLTVQWQLGKNADGTNGTNFVGTVGDLSEELPNNSTAVFDFSSLSALSGAIIDGETSFDVSINYPT